MQLQLDDLDEMVVDVCLLTLERLMSSAPCAAASARLCRSDL